MTRQLILTRKSHINALARKFYVQVNGATVAQISNGETITLQIPTSVVTLKILPPSGSTEMVTIPGGTGTVTAEAYWQLGLMSSTLKIKYSMAPDTNYGAAPQGSPNFTFIFCQYCGTKLRVPDNGKTLEIKCPTCGKTFVRNGSAANNSYNAYNTYNELDSYKKGGSRRRELPVPSETRDTRVLLRALIASWSASYIANSMFDRSGELWKTVLIPNNATIDYVKLRYTNDKVYFDVAMRNAPIPSYTYDYAYSEIFDTIPNNTFLEDWELQMMYEMAYTHLADIMPHAKLMNNCVSE